MAVVTVQELVAGLADTEMRVVGVPQRWTKQMARGFATLPVEFVSSRPQLPVRTPHVTSRHIETVKRRTTSVTLVARSSRPTSGSRPRSSPRTGSSP